jgi:hypothetical protein
VELAEKLDLIPEQAGQILAAYAEDDNPQGPSVETPDGQTVQPPPTGTPFAARTITASADTYKSLGKTSS